MITNNGWNDPKTTKLVRNERMFEVQMGMIHNNSMQINALNNSIATPTVYSSTSIFSRKRLLVSFSYYLIRENEELKKNIEGFPLVLYTFKLFIFIIITLFSFISQTMLKLKGLMYHHYMFL